MDKIAIISPSGAMKPHGSSLNPFATSYIPLSQRGANRTFIGENTSRENIGANLPGYSEQCVYNPPYNNSISPRLNMNHGKKASVAGAAVKNHPFLGSLSQQSSDLTEMEMFDREVNMDIELLQVSFPGLSEQSLTDVYFANKGDLDAAIDMLSQLEVFSISPLVLVNCCIEQTWLTNIALCLYNVLINVVNANMLN